MADSLEALATWLDPVIHKLDTAERARLMATLAKWLRSRNQQRIKQQVTPDGQHFEPRKKQLRTQQGNIRRGAMFTKLRLNRFMRIATSAHMASVQIASGAGRIANIHHHGLRDRLGDIDYEYPQRQLLGFSDEDREELIDFILTHIGES